MVEDEINDCDTRQKNISQEEWILLLWSLLSDFPEKDWEEFAQELIYKNRFTVSHKIINVIKECADQQARTIKEGQTLYRARVYQNDPLREFLAEVFGYDEIENDEKSCAGKASLKDLYNTQLVALCMALEKKTPKSKEIIGIYKKWKRKRFKGYNAKESGIPPKESTRSGRINPEKISYLYLSEDPLTSVYEVRPIIGQNVSVATFKTTEEIKIYDMTQRAAIRGIENGNNPDNISSLFDVIQRKFSEPNTGELLKYLPTQYLGETIKQMGFDGIRFGSSLKKDGINVVLFDSQKCKATKSDIIMVNEIELKCVKSDLYELEKFMNPKERKE